MTEATRGVHRGRRRFTNGAAVVVGTLGIVCLTAACGGSAGPGVASLGATTTIDAATAAASSPTPGNLQQVYQAQLQFSECMRKHGEPTYPDPVLSAHGINISVGGANIDPKSAKFISASTACKKLVPDGGPPSGAQRQAMIDSALKNAECMRTHGVPNFPDPVVSNGGISIRLGGDGIDPNSPEFQAAQKTCQKLAPLAGP